MAELADRRGFTSTVHANHQPHFRLVRRLHEKGIGIGFKTGKQGTNSINQEGL